MPEEIDIVGEAQRQTRQISIRPTILIGLGGTGKEVLMRLRRMFYEKHGTVGWPIMEYLWFDTDMQNININREQYDAIDQRLYFEGDEIVSGKIQPAELADYYANYGSFPHIFRWFNRDALQGLGTAVFTQGAGQIRPFGRLAFFHSYSRLRATLSRKRDAVTTAIPRMVSLGHQVDNTLEIMIVTSLAGGTGAGAFIDIAFLCKDLAPNALITGILFLPQTFEGNNNIPQEVVNANGYASLKELNHYLSRNGDSEMYFEVDWDNSGTKRIPCPPFATVYLLENRNHLNQHTGDYLDAFQMTAEFLMLDFEQSPFATSKRSNRSNMEQFLHTEARYRVFPRNAQPGDLPVYVQYFPNRYSSFGLSQIQFNQPKVASAAAYRLGALMLQFWLSEDSRVDPVAVDRGVKNSITEIGLSINRLVNAMMEETYGTDDEQLIDNSFMELMNEINNMLSEKSEGVGSQRRLALNIDSFRAFCDNIINEAQNNFNKLKQDFDTRLGQQGFTPGIDLKKLQDNKNTIEERLRSQLESRVVDMLSNPAEYGVPFVQAYITEVTAHIRQLISDVLNETQSPNEFSLEMQFDMQGEGSLQRSRRLLQSARDLPSIAPFSIFAKSRAINHYQERLEQAHQKYLFGNLERLRHLLQQKQNEFKQYIRTRYQYEALNRLAHVDETGVLNNLVAYLNAEAYAERGDLGVDVRVVGIDQNVQMFRDNLGEFLGYFGDNADAYQRVIPSERNFNIALDIDYRDEIRQYYRESIGTDQLSDILTRLSNRFFVSAGLIEVEDLAQFDDTRINALTEGVKSIYRRSARKEEQAAEWLEVRNRLENFVLEQMRELRKNDSAIQYFRQSFQGDDNGMVSALENRVRLGAIRIQPPTTRFTEFGGVRQLAILGIHPPDDPIIEDIKNSLSTENNPYQNAVPQDHASDSILFFVELVAFPAFYVGGLRDLRGNYEKNLSENPNHVFYRHTDKNHKKYRDICPPADDAEARSRLSTHQLMMQSLLLETVRYEKGNFCVPYLHRTLIRKRPLSESFEESVNMLNRLEDVKVALQKANGEIFRRWEEQSDIDAYYQYLSLLQYMVEEVYPAQDVTDDAQLFSLNSRVAEELFSDVLSKVKTLVGQSDKEVSNSLSQLDLKAFSEEVEYNDTEMQAKIRVFRGGLDKDALPELQMGS